MVGLLYIGFMIAIFYFLLIRPQQKKQKAAFAMQSALKKGDKIVTISGLHGEVISVADFTMVVQIAKGTNVTLDKGAVRNVVEEAAVTTPAVEETTTEA